VHFATLLRFGVRCALSSDAAACLFGATLLGVLVFVLKREVADAD
jgi:hypothetical protein